MKVHRLNMCYSPLFTTGHILYFFQGAEAIGRLGASHLRFVRKDTISFWLFGWVFGLQRFGTQFGFSVEPKEAEALEGWLAII